MSVLFSPLQLVGGMVAAALSFLMSGLLQIYLPESSSVPYCHGDISIMWQLPQLLLISFAEVLVSVTGLEFAYSQAPPDFRYIHIATLMECIKLVSTLGGTN